MAFFFGEKFKLNKDNTLRLRIPIGSLDKPFKPLEVIVERDGYNFPITDVNQVLNNTDCLNNKDLKKPMTTEDLIKHLKDVHNISFSQDEEKQASSDLRVINYYRISAFRKHIHVTTPSYTDLRILYNFDRYLRDSLSRLLPGIEVYLKTSLARFLSTNYGNYKSADSELSGGLAYLDDSIYINKPNKIKEVNLMRSIFAEELVKKINKDNMITHHVIQYGGKIPIWVLFEEITLGQFSKFVSLLNDDVLKGWVNTILPKLPTSFCRSGIKSWISTIQLLRNKVAHSSKVYGEHIPYNPKLLQEDKDMVGSDISDSNFYDTYQHTIFGGLLTVKIFYNDLRLSDQESWNHFLEKIKERICNSSVIKHEELGFPDNWYRCLTLI